MCQLLASIDWLKVVQTIAVVFTAFVAYSALNTWKHQAKAKKQTDFLDELTDIVHEYIQSLSRPTEFLKYIYIGIDSHQGITPQAENNERSHIIAYINSRGVEDSKSLWGYINSCSKLAAKIESLVARGQVYGFENYIECQNSVKMLIWQHQRLQIVASMIGSPTMNWQHPKVINGIENMLTVQPKDIEKHLTKYNLTFIEFVNENYKGIYKGT